MKKSVSDHPREKHAWIHREDDIVDGGKRFARLIVHQYCYWEGFLEYKDKRLRFKLVIAVNGEYNYDIVRKFVTRVALEGRLGLNGRYGMGKLWEKAAWKGFFTCEYKFRPAGEK